MFGNHPYEQSQDSSGRVIIGSGVAGTAVATLTVVPGYGGVLGDVGTPSAVGTGFALQGSKWTDNNTAASSTAAAYAYSSFAQGSLLATNANVTTNNAYEVNIIGPPIASTHERIGTSTALNIGPGLTVSNATTTFALVATAPIGGVNNYAAAFLGGNVGIGTTGPSSTLAIQGSGSTTPFIIASSTGSQLFALDTSGNITDGNYPNCSGFTTNASGLIQCTASDQRLKQDITPLGSQSGIAAINALNPVSFYWQDPSRGTTQQFGFIAQQVQQIFPNLVSTTTATALTPGGTLTLNYDGLISPLILATQELSASSAAMQSSIEVLQSQISNLQNSLGGNVSSNNLAVYQPSNFSGDSVGEAEIPAGQTSVRVSFSQPYVYQPIVTFSPEGAFVPAFIVAKDNAGFTLELQTATTTSVTFDWHSFASPQEQLTVSGGSTAPIVLVQPPTAASANATPLAGISEPFDSPTSTPDGTASFTPPDSSASSSAPAIVNLSTSTAPSALPSPIATPISPPTPTPTPTPSPVSTPTPLATPVVAVTPVPLPTQTVSQAASPTPTADSQNSVPSQ